MDRLLLLGFLNTDVQGSNSESILGVIDANT